MLEAEGPTMTARRDRSKAMIYRDMCLALDVVELARLGVLGPDPDACGPKLLGITGVGRDFEVGIRRLPADSGGFSRLRLDWPDLQDLAVARVDTPIGPRWLLICPFCHRRVRRLLLPEERPPALRVPWACRHCWRIGYRDEAARAHDTLKKLRRIRAACDVLERHERLSLVEHARIRRRIADDFGSDPE